MHADSTSHRSDVTASPLSRAAEASRIPGDPRPAKVGKWTEPALRVLRERYLMRQGGEVVETPEEMCWRGGPAVASGGGRDRGGGAAGRGGRGGGCGDLIQGGVLP